jgi:hypothetical protein
MTTPVRDLSAEERAELARLIVERRLIAGVAFVRAATGATLAQATAIARVVAVEIGAITPRNPEPQLSGELLAIGAFSRSIAPFLDYDVERYEGVPDGAPVIVTITDAYETEDTFALAASFGVDLWDFNAHAPLDAARIDLETLGALDDAASERFVRLRDAGFTFYFYLPPNEDASCTVLEDRS